MQPKIFALVAGLALAAAGSAQTLPQYIALRKKCGISAEAGTAALNTVVGSRILEISGMVVGSMTVKGERTLILENGNDRNDHIQTKSIPDWLIGNDIKARLIVSAKREPGKGESKLTLLGVARDADVALIEEQEQAERAAAEARRVAKPVYVAPKGNRARRMWTVPLSEVTPIYARYIQHVNRKLSDGEAYHIAQALVGFSVKYGVDARLIISMVVAESDFNPNETSHSGAMGLGQLMPGTARDFGITNAYDTTENLFGTVREIRNDLKRYRNTADNPYENLRLALAAYNAGIGAVARAGGVPNYRETQAYVKKVIKLYYKLCGLSE